LRSRRTARASSLGSTASRPWVWTWSSARIGGSTTPSPSRSSWLRPIAVDGGRPEVAGGYAQNRLVGGIWPNP